MSSCSLARRSSAWLKRARQVGIVAIHLEAPVWLRLDLEGGLCDTFGLSEAVVSVAQADPQAERNAVAQRAAQYLERRLRNGNVVAVSHGRATGAVARFFRLLTG